MSGLDDASATTTTPATKEPAWINSEKVDAARPSPSNNKTTVAPVPLPSASCNYNPSTVNSACGTTWTQQSVPDPMVVQLPIKVESNNFLCQPSSLNSVLSMERNLPGVVPIKGGIPALSLIINAQIDCSRRLPRLEWTHHRQQ